MSGKSTTAAKQSQAGIAQNVPDRPVPTASEDPVRPCRHERHWFGVRVTDEAGKPVKGLTVSLTLSDGSTTRVTLPDHGAHTTDRVLPAGQCQISLPDVLDVEWWTKGTDPKALPLPDATTTTDGECLASVADRLGVRDYRTLWENGANATLASTWTNPNLLAAGVTIQTSQAKGKVETRAVDQVWDFVARAKRPTMLRLVLLDADGKPLAKKKWTLTAPAAKSGTTGDDGLVEIAEIPPQATAGTLTVTMREPPPPVTPPPVAPADPPKYPAPIKPAEYKDTAPPAPKPEDDVVEWTLAIGALPPHDRPGGVPARLHNFGFACDVDSDAATIEKAVKRYQTVVLGEKTPSGKAADVQDDVHAKHDRP